VGYTEVVHTMLDRMNPDASVVIFGGLAGQRPYPGSTTVTMVNGAVTAMVKTMAVELAPIRFNAIHPGIIGDTPADVACGQPIGALTVAVATGSYDVAALRAAGAAHVFASLADTAAVLDAVLG